MKFKTKAVVLAAVVAFLSATTAYASHETYIYTDYNAVVQVYTYAESDTQGTDYQQISLKNSLLRDGSQVSRNEKVCRDTDYCKTSTLQTYHESKYEYSSSSSHTLFENDRVVAVYRSLKIL